MARIRLAKIKLIQQQESGYEGKSFQTMQQQFCDWIRDPDLVKHFLLKECKFIGIYFLILIYWLSLSSSSCDVARVKQLLLEFFQKAKSRSPLYTL